MTASFAVAPAILPRASANPFRHEPLFAAGAFCMLALIPPTLFAMAVDQRTLLDVNVWIKPLKFEIALAVYLATLAWFAGFLPAGMTARRSYRLFAIAVTLAVAAEMIWIGGAAMFGVASHFNTGSAFMRTNYPVMGAFAVLLTSASLVYGVAILRQRSARLDPALRLALGLGLVLTFVLTVLSAGYMSSQPGHLAGAVRMTDAGGVSFFGWSREAGDLRIAHFFATHAMHFIPAFGFLAARLLPARAGTGAVASFSAFYTALVLFIFITAALGQPLLPRGFSF